MDHFPFRPNLQKIKVRSIKSKSWGNWWYTIEFHSWASQCNCSPALSLSLDRPPRSLCGSLLVCTPDRYFGVLCGVATRSFKVFGNWSSGRSSLPFVVLEESVFKFGCDCVRCRQSEAHGLFEADVDLFCDSVCWWKVCQWAIPGTGRSHLCDFCFRMQ